MADDAGTDLTVLVCSANVGNAEPTPESFAEWIPDDGDIEGPLSQTKYPVDAAGAEKVAASLKGTGKKFDIIAIGMQEAAFVEKSLKKKGESSNDYECLDSERDGDGNGNGVQDKKKGGGKVQLKAAVNANIAATRMASVDDEDEGVVSTVHNGVYEAHKKGSKAKKGLFKKAAKTNLILRGLAVSQTYKSPKLRNSQADMKERLRENTTLQSGSYDTRKIRELILDRCPSYEIVAAKLRGEMRLVVLALKELHEEINDVYVAAENTGIGSVLANKGGIITTINLRDTRLSFMTAHLEAHEGATHYMNRNKNLAEIFEGAKPDPNYYMHDATLISHHMFVCGDLNYRINFNDDEEGPKKKRNSETSKSKKRTVVKRKIKSKMISEPVLDVNRSSLPEERGAANGSHFDEAKALVDSEDWKALNDGDELAKALEKNECLVGFKTLPCNFPPTFKVARGEGYQYNEKRTPSYTDRILWKSAAGMDNVVPFLYEPCPDFITSDHKPIRGGYTLNTNKSLPIKSSTKIANERKLHLLVKDLKCHNLPIMDSEILGGLCDPYILFVSYPKKLLWKKGWPLTKVKERDLDPKWEEHMFLTLENEGYRDNNGNISLDGSMLYMTIMDEDMTSGDDVVGTVALNLKKMFSGIDWQGQSGPRKKIVTRVSEAILRNGTEFGMLECTIEAVYLKEKEIDAFLQESAEVRSKRKISLKSKITRLLHLNKR